MTDMGPTTDDLLRRAKAGDSAALGALFAQMGERTDIDPSHAFYLGYEMAKALTALTLGKNYTQDQALRWGFLTVEEGL